MSWTTNEMLRLLASAPEAAKAADESGGDWAAILGLALVVLFFGWLILAFVRKALRGKGARFRDVPEDQAEAARTARLWAEARRRTAEEADEEEEEGPEEPSTSVQEELLERAQTRRDERGDVDEELQRQHEAKLRALRDMGAEDEEEEFLEGEGGAGEEEGPAGEEPAPAPVVEKPAPAPAAEEPAPAPVVEKPAPAPVVEGPPRSLEEGLSATRSGFVSRLTSMFGRGALSEDQVEEIEEILFTADIGVRTAQKLLEFLQKEIGRKERGDPRMLLQALKERIRAMLDLPAPPLDFAAHKPEVVLLVGVNGTGKTTTIGKLAQRFARDGKRVVLAAGDTFRAAAAEQLQVWGQRSGTQVIRGQDGSDPGAVVFNAISAARSQGADLVLADTAGRLHTKVNLVEELRKIQRVCGKAMEGAPHHVWLVLDATTGQNAINQAKEFHQALSLTGIVLTKLDGTAKGGVVIGIADTFGIPVRYIGIGEGVEDLRPFQAEAFVKALFL
ncbi:MAG TPA: signal recognition particle-docking protein FtsY [Myxococcota bacterium]|nr:signal recognition particle-docking protein FtsY [Myxococcota bacterium]HRY92573.1 signal recognition particle-docking protein FtsY [Myxococcota bacterium]